MQDSLIAAWLGMLMFTVGMDEERQKKNSRRAVGSGIGGRADSLRNFANEGKLSLIQHKSVTGEKFVALMQRCTNNDPKKRPSGFEEIVDALGEMQTELKESQPGSSVKLFENPLVRKATAEPRSKSSSEWRRGGRAPGTEFTIGATIEDGIEQVRSVRRTRSQEPVVEGTNPMFEAQQT